MFDKEVYGYKKTTNLLNVKNNTHYEIINSEYPHFYEEKMESGREKAAVRPWLANILPPEHEIVENTELPKYSLKIDHVFGFRNDDTRQNVFFLSEDQMKHHPALLYLDIFYLSFHNGEQHLGH